MLGPVAINKIITVLVSPESGPVVRSTGPRHWKLAFDWSQEDLDLLDFPAYFDIHGVHHFLNDAVTTNIRISCICRHGVAGVSVDLIPCTRDGIP